MRCPVVLVKNGIAYAVGPREVAGRYRIVSTEGGVLRVAKYNPFHGVHGYFASGDFIGNKAKVVNDAMHWIASAPVKDVVKQVVHSEAAQGVVSATISSLLAHGLQYDDPIGHELIAEHIHNIATHMQVSAGVASSTLREIVTGMKQLRLPEWTQVKKSNDPVVDALDKILAGLDAYDELKKDNPNHDEHGRFATGSSGGVHPGSGYSKQSYLLNGTIYTHNVSDAILALSENKKVQLDQLRSVSTLITKLGKVAADMINKGEAAPNYNLCNVSVAGSNLFCAESKGIPRVNMPQIPRGDVTEQFKQHLIASGYGVTDTTEKASYLRSTQNELNGVRVARLAQKMTSGNFKEGDRIFVSKDNYIVDGHHRWAAAIGVDAKDGKLGDQTIPITRVNIGIVELLKEAQKYSRGPASFTVKFNPNHGEHGQFASGGTLGTGDPTIFENIHDAMLWAHSAPVKDIVGAVVHSQPFKDALIFAVASLMAYVAQNVDVLGAVHEIADDVGVVEGQAADALRSVITGLKNAHATGIFKSARNDAITARFNSILNELDEHYPDAGSFGKENPNHDEHGRFASGSSSGSESVNQGTLRSTVDKVANELGYDPSKIYITDAERLFTLNGQEMHSAGSADVSSIEPLRRVTLYSGHINEQNVAGVTAHEIMHEKFQSVMDAYRREMKSVMSEPGPTPDPNGQLAWQRAGLGNAVMKPDGSLYEPYDKKYPIYSAIHEAYNQFPIKTFAESDGVSSYSYEYWKGWKAGNIQTDLAFHETLAEMARIQYESGGLPEEHMGPRIMSYRDSKQTNKEITEGQKRWRNLYDTVNRVYKTLKR